MNEDEDTQGNWYRRKVGRRIERAVNRLIAGGLGGLGALAGYLSLPTEEHGVRWLGMLGAAALFWLARKCWAARGSVIE